MLKKLEWDAITEVKMDYPAGWGYGDPYREQPTQYMVKVKGANRWRRVHAAAIGNVAVFYLKSKEGLTYCETALDHATECVSRTPEQGPCGHDYDAYVEFHRSK